MSTDNDTPPEIQQQSLIDHTRLDCILATLQAQLPVDENGEPELGFILVLAKNGEVGCDYGAYSNLKEEDKDSLLKGLLDKEPSE